MNTTEVIDLVYGREVLSQDICDRAIEALEVGHVVFLPRYGFPVTDSDKPLFSPAVLNKESKNVSYNPSTRKLGGITTSEETTALLQDMMQRFADFARELVIRVLPDYRNGLTQARASFRPVEIEGRVSSWRKDDTRLHVDAFPSSPTQGKRILRLFCNINPDGRSRIWRIGEPFEQTAKRFISSIKPPLPFSGALLQLFGVTKSRQTPYDYYMLRLHDAMKADERYQAEVEKVELDFPPGSTWLVFADQVSHAAIRGQYQLEQTFLVDVEQLRDKDHSPLRALERLVGRKLI
jgi:3-deoxy-D-manno-oct-2-ulosonic acid (Kdo) hydroxylase